MAPVVFPHPISYAAVAAPGVHVASVVYLTYTVATSLLTSYRALSPPQDTRSRATRRAKLIPVFIALAALAFSVAAFAAVDVAFLSYRVWADQRGLKAPPSWFPHKNSLGHDDTELYLGQWLSDTPVYRDALEIIVERSRRFWWGQQIDLATLSWSVLLAVEGRRRGIRNLPAFLTLAHLVNLSYAQNLFYLALLVTPAPLSAGGQDLALPSNPLPGWGRLRGRLLTSKPASWQPRPAIFYSSIALGFGSIFMLPYAAGTPSFATVAFLARATTFLPVLAPYLVPASWGRVNATPHESYASLTTLFRTISLVSLVLHYKASAVGLVNNAPDSHYHRHSAFLPWDVNERSKWDRSTTAIGKILGSVSDHPAVQAVGFDVLISAFSLGIWAAVRAVDVRDIIASAVPGVALTHDGLASKSKSSEAVGNNDTTATGKSAQDTATRRRGRSHKALTNGDNAGDMYEPSPAEAALLAEGDILPAEELDKEAGALSWGLAALLGLASASSGVFGAECTSR
ncbi:hypothetical protein Micbo1qcDRAFT_8244 [Microdochium bolleyi]|uniref:Uncharacterized protein n=1 Tax=Microdochium bolleyi TaxID=196109 RepID=A0A136JK13_9PEZI|nr:hypothetical protein Micbo1qcDRAFT_8244 [Microdochium bolleyi]